MLKVGQSLIKSPFKTDRFGRAKNLAVLVQKSLIRETSFIEGHFQTTSKRFLVYPLNVNEHVSQDFSMKSTKNLDIIKSMEPGEVRDGFIQKFLHEMFFHMDHLEKGADAIGHLTDTNKISTAGAFLEIIMISLNIFSRRAAVQKLLDGLSPEMRVLVMKELSLQARCKVALLRLFS